jgi:hypothetical protein
MEYQSLYGRYIVEFSCVHNSLVKKVAHYVGEHVTMDVIISGLPAVHTRMSFLFSCCKCLVLWDDETGREQIRSRSQQSGMTEDDVMSTVL